MEARIFYMIPMAVIVIALNTVAIIFVIKLLILLYKALRKYLSSGPQRQESQILRRSLGEVLKEHRTRCSMTQEFVAESLNVSRQAVSKWENGTADPSTSNLLKLAKLYGISEYPARKTMEAARRFRPEFCAAAARLVLETDYKIKTSFDDPVRLLELLILELAQEAAHG